jgi:hypothetical protein
MPLYFYYYSEIPLLINTLRQLFIAPAMSCGRLLETAAPVSDLSLFNSHFSLIADGGALLWVAPPRCPLQARGFLMVLNLCIRKASPPVFQPG